MGTIERHIAEKRVIGIEVENGVIRRGERIAYSLPTCYVEQNVDSLEVDNQAVTEADAVTLVGIETVLDANEVKIGTQVFRVRVTDFDNSPVPT